MGMITRRDFLAVLGVAAGGYALAYAPEVSVQAFREAWGEDWVEVPKGPERWAPSLCQQCPGGCGIRVKLIGDRPVKIDGNPLHPINKGKLCPKGQAGLHTLYDPDRIKGPLKRGGERGAGKWENISWGEAIHLVATRLSEIRSRENAHTLAMMDGNSRGLIKNLFERFLYSFGSPNYIRMPTGLDYGQVDAFYLMQGIKGDIVFDMERAKYIISFGSDLLQSFWSPVQVMKAFGSMRREKDLRGRIVQVEPRYSVTAAKADEWVPIKPGTEGILALGMAHLMIKEGLYHKEFIQEHAFGFNDWEDSSGINHQGFMTLVLQNYSPGTVSDITDVPVDTIIRLAREFATENKSLAIGTRGDIYQQMAIHSLNALAGNIDKPGGINLVKSLLDIDLRISEIDETAYKCLQMPHIGKNKDGKFPLAAYSIETFFNNVLKGEPYKLNTLLLYNCNPLFSNFDIKFIHQVIKKIPFMISFSSFMDETTHYSDLILPDHTYLEKWQNDITYTFQGFPVVGIGRPIVKPLYDTQNTGDAIIEIARGMGGSVARAFLWKNSKEMLLDIMKKVFEIERGDLFGLEFEEAWVKILARGGWRAPSYRDFDEFWEGMQEKGGWWDPIYRYEEWEKVFQTPSKKFEFYSQILKFHLENQENPKRDKDEIRIPGIEARGDQLFLPHWEPRINSSPAEEKDYPLHLKVFQPLAVAGLINANQPFLQDISSFYTEERWGSWVEINPETAEELGIRGGDWVWVESAMGRLMLRARLTHGAMPHVVSVPMGFGHKAFGRWAKGFGENPAWLMTHHAEPFTGEPLLHKTRVKAYKA